LKPGSYLRLWESDKAQMVHLEYEVLASFAEEEPPVVSCLPYTPEHYFQDDQYLTLRFEHATAKEFLCSVNNQTFQIEVQDVPAQQSQPIHLIRNRG
jgi:hypothetical protein